MKKTSILMLLVLMNSGCATIMHELQPHRLRRLNYQDPVGRTDGVYFSVDDPLPVSRTSQFDFTTGSGQVSPLPHAPAPVPAPAADRDNPSF